MKHPARTADTWISEALSHTEKAKAAFRNFHLHTLNAGVFFIKARETAGEGNFGTLLLNYSKQISRRSAYRYMEFAEAALTWAKQERPDLSDPELLNYARSMCLQSPREFIALLRSETVNGQHLLRPFGEYDAVRYQSRKLGQSTPVKFNFSKGLTVLDTLAHLDAPEFVFDLPDGTSQVEALAELEQKLELSLTKVRAVRSTLTIET